MPNYVLRIRRGYTLSAESGSFSWNGTDATLAHSGATPFASEDFEGYTAGQSIVGQTNGSLTWLAPVSGSPALVSDAVAYQGTKSLQFKFGPGVYADGKPNGEVRFNLGQDCPELWFEMRVFFSDGTTPAGIDAFNLDAQTSNKFINHWGVQLDTPSSSDASYDETYCGVQLFGNAQTDGAGVNVHFPDFYPGDTPMLVTPATRGTWILWQQHVKFSSGQGVEDGRWRFLIDGTLHDDLTLAVDPSVSGHSFYYRFGMLGGSAETLGAGREQHFYIDALKWYDSDPGW